MCYGLVAPGNAMATAVAAQMCGEAENAEFHEGSMDAKLKLMGIDVASFGVYNGGPGWDDTLPFAYCDPFKGTYKKLLFSKDGKRLMGGGPCVGATRVRSSRLSFGGLRWAVVLSGC